MVNLVPLRDGEVSCDVVGPAPLSACGSLSSVTQQTGESQLNCLGCWRGLAPADSSLWSRNNK